MPRARENPEATLSAAEKQRRHRQKQQEETDRLRGVLYRLERAVWAASDAGSLLALTVRASSPDAILDNLCVYFEDMEKTKG